MFIGPHGLRDNLDDFWMIDLDDFFENCLTNFLRIFVRMTWTSTKRFTIQNFLKQPNCQLIIVTLLTFSLTTHKSYAEASFKSLFAC